MKRILNRSGWLLAVVLLSLLGPGCTGPEAANTSSRPWNTPRGYDSGLPGMYDPH